MDHMRWNIFLLQAEQNMFRVQKNISFIILMKQTFFDRFSNFFYIKNWLNNTKNVFALYIYFAALIRWPSPYSRSYGPSSQFTAYGAETMFLNRYPHMSLPDLLIFVSLRVWLVPSTTCTRLSIYSIDNI